jgi:hypothetical protein
VIAGDDAANWRISRHLPSSDPPERTAFMDHRDLGASGILIPPLVFGGNVFGWSADEATSFKLLDALVAGGLNAIDTADMYSTWVPGHKGGESETIIGKWLASRGGRDKLVIMTKVGMDMGDGKGLSAAWIKTSVERSLKRLRPMSSTCIRPIRTTRRPRWKKRSRLSAT